MRPLLCMVLLVGAFCALGQDTAAPPRPNPPKDKDRWGWTIRLRDDVTAALPRAQQLDAKHRRAVEKDIHSLQQAIQAHQDGKKVDQEKLNHTLRSIHDQFRSQAFAAEDRENVLDDLYHLPIKEKVQKPPRAPRPRNPFPRRYPRF